MKTSLLTLLFTFVACSVILGQNQIKLISGKKIKIEDVHKIEEMKVLYIQEGSMHDVAVEEILFIKLNDHIITFDENNKPVYDQWKQVTNTTSEARPTTSPKTKTKDTASTATTATPKNKMPAKTVEKIGYKPKTSLFIRPMATMEMYGLATFGTNIPIGDGIFMKNSFGVIMHNYGKVHRSSYDYGTGSYNSETRLKGGYDVRIEFKKVVSGNKNPKELAKNFYISADLGYKQANFSVRSREKTGEIVNYYGYTYPTYSDWRNSTEAWSVVMTNAKFGRQLYSYTGVFVDAYVGLGARFSSVNRDFTFSSRINCTMGLDFGFSF